MKRWTMFVFLCLSLLFFAAAPPSLEAREPSTPQMVIGMGHATEVKNLWLSADGKSLVSQSDDRIIIWDAAARRVLNVIEGATIYDIAADGAGFATRTGEEAISFWRIKTGAPAFRVEGEDDCAFNLSGRYVVCRQSESNGVIVRNPADGAAVLKIDFNERLLVDYAFADGDKLIVASRVAAAKTAGEPLNYLEVYDVKQKAPLLALNNQTEWGVSANGKTLVARDASRNLIVYDVSAQKKKEFFEPPVETFSLSPSGRYYMHLLKSGALKVLKMPEADVKFEQANQTGLWQKNFTPAEKFLYEENEGVLSLYDLEQSAPPITVPAGDRHEFSPHDRFVAVISSTEESAKLTVWDLETKKIAFSTPETGERITSLDFSPDSRYLAAEFNESGATRLVMWETASWRETVLDDDRSDLVTERLATMMEAPLEPPSMTMERVTNPDLPISGSNDPPRTMLISLKADNKRRAVEDFSESGGGVNLAFSTTGKVLARGTGGAITLFDTTTGKPLPPLENHIAPVEISFSADKKNLVLKRGSLESRWNFPAGGFAPQLPKKTAVNRAPEWWELYDYDQEGDVYTVKSKKTGRVLLRKTGVESCQPSDNFKLVGCSIATDEEDVYTVEIIDLATRRALFRIPKVVSRGYFGAFTFSDDSLRLSVLREAPRDEDNASPKELRLEIWTTRGKLAYASPTGFDSYNLDDGWKNLLLGFYDRLELHNLTAKQVKTFPYEDDFEFDLGNETAFSSPSGKLIGFTSDEAGSGSTIHVWNTVTNSPFWQTRHAATVINAIFSPDDRFLLTGSRDGSVKVWDIGQEKLLVTLIPLDEQDWVVKDAEGFFDASPGAARLLAWQTDGELLNYEQMSKRRPDYIKNRFVPNLWRKKMTGN